METILSYLDNMFLSLPRTPETERAKAELAAMMEDKYNELLSEGKRENEAVGIVISEFGNLEELSEELGLERVYGETEPEENGTDKRYVSRDEAERYLSSAGKSYKWIAFGVLLCICSPIPLIMLGITDNAADVSVICLGIVPLLMLVAVAVAIFIYHGMKLEKFEFLKKEPLQLDEGFRRELKERKEYGEGKFAAALIVGVLLCIFSVIQLLVAEALRNDNALVLGLSVAVFLLCVGIGVFCFITAGGRWECLNILLEEGDYSPQKKRNAELLKRIGSIYWPVVTAIYLAWGFITMNWGFNWIIWPVAGVLFGVVAAVCNIVKGKETI